jgi:hypothetical protein
MLITTKIDFKIAEPVQYLFAILAVASVTIFVWRSFRLAKQLS